MIECKEIEMILSAYIENELDKETQNQVRNHMQSCVRCQALKDSVEFLISKLPGLEEDISFFIKNRLLNIAEVGQESKKRFRFLAFPKWAAAVIGTVFLFFNLFYFTNIFPAANRQAHFFVARLGKLISQTEGWIEKAKDTKNILFFSLFKKWQVENESGKSRNEHFRDKHIDEGGKNG